MTSQTDETPAPKRRRGQDLMAAAREGGKAGALEVLVRLGIDADNPAGIVAWHRRQTWIDQQMLESADNTKAIRKAVWNVAIPALIFAALEGAKAALFPSATAHTPPTPPGIERKGP